jgi:hypothetical protein
MIFNKSFLLTIVAASLFLLSACDRKTALPVITVFKGMKLFITSQQFEQFVDSLVKEDPSFRKAMANRYYYCEFAQQSESGFHYYGYLIPTFDNGLLTELKVFYTPQSDPYSVEKYSYSNEQNLMYWGRTGNIVYNDLNLQLQIKYGIPSKTGNAVSHHVIANYEFIYSQWDSQDLQVMLLREVEKDDGLNTFPFCNYFIVYRPSEQFMAKNREILTEKYKAQSMY